MTMIRGTAPAPADLVRAAGAAVAAIAQPAA
jgi:hypothetical protein